MKISWIGLVELIIDHIGWATSMSFTSINSTNPRIHVIFVKNIENWRSWKMTFCLVFSFFVFGYWVFQKKNFSFINERLKASIYGNFFCTKDGFFRILKKTSIYLHATVEWSMDGSKSISFFYSSSVWKGNHQIRKDGSILTRPCFILCPDKICTNLIY